MIENKKDVGMYVSQPPFPCLYRGGNVAIIPYFAEYVEVSGSNTADLFLLPKKLTGQ